MANLEDVISRSITTQVHSRKVHSAQPSNVGAVHVHIYPMGRFYVRYHAAAFTEVLHQSSNS